MATLSSLAFALLFSALLSVTVVAQSENGSISGTVKDSAGAVFSGAAVSLTRARAILALPLPLFLILTCERACENLFSQ